MAEFMKIFQGMDLSSFEGDGEGEMSDEDMQKMMSQFTDLLGGDLGDLPLDLGEADFLSEGSDDEGGEEGVEGEEEEEGLPTGSE